MIESQQRQTARRTGTPRVRLVQLAAAVVLLGGGFARAQAPAPIAAPTKPSPTDPTTAKPAVKKPATSKAAAARGTGNSATHARKQVVTPPPPVVAEPIAVQAPPEPEKPKWPAFDPAAAASVVWDSRGLSINATNSSLQAIMKEVATETGTKVEGLSSDQRVFGIYGPGQARDVLSQLLQGSGYNVIMIGDLGAGAPREILLSMRQSTGGPAQPNARPNPVNNDEDAEPEEPQEQPERPPMGIQPRPQPPFNQERPQQPGPPFGNQVPPQNPQN